MVAKGLKDTHTYNNMAFSPKFHEAMSIVGPDGLTGYQRRAAKRNANLLAKDPDYHFKQAQKMLKAMGPEGLKKRGKAIYDSVVANGNKEARDQKIRAVKLAKLSDEYRTGIRRYRNIVMGLSRKHDLSDLPNFELWGSGGYELDHKFSIAEGFAMKLAPELLAVKGNLQFIPKKDNVVKGRKCAITLEELKALQC